MKDFCSQIRENSGVSGVAQKSHDFSYHCKLRVSAFQKCFTGQGKLFFKNGTAHGYINWRPGEPNNSGGIESFLQWNHYLRKGDVAGTWNDQPIDKKGSTGYFVEYGGT